MVSVATRTEQWERASYLDLEGAPTGPQAIGTLLPQVLARYLTPANVPRSTEERPQQDLAEAELIHGL